MILNLERLQVPQGALGRPSELQKGWLLSSHKDYLSVKNFLLCLSIQTKLSRTLIEEVQWHRSFQHCTGPRQQCAEAVMLSKSPSQLRLNNNLHGGRTSSTDLKKRRFAFKDSYQAGESVGELDLLYLQSLLCEQLHSAGIKLNRCWLLFVNVSKVVYLNSIHVNRVLSPLNCFCFIRPLTSHSRECLWFT